jgi:sulfatase maturation enzyme AslB (radical SAM superfamily)
MRVCCNSTANGRLKDNQGNLINITDVTDVVEFYNIQQLKSIRKRMLNNERTPECDICYAVEDNGGVSVRQMFEKQWPKERIVADTNPSTGEISKVNVNYLDLSWSNKCNLQCKMCSPSASDQLIEEAIELQLPIIKDNPGVNWDFKDSWKYPNVKSVIEKIVTPALSQVLVTGGEPLVNNDFYTLCQILIERGMSQNIDLSFHTNLTVTPGKWFDIWSKFKSVTIKISIDGVEEVYEYIRYPGKWSIVKDNIDSVIEYANTQRNIGIEFHTVFSIYNTERFTDLLEYIASLKSTTKITRIPHINYIYWPDYSSPTMLPKDYKLKVVQEITQWLKDHKHRFPNKEEIEKIKIIKSMLSILVSNEATDYQKQASYQIIAKMDAYRGHETRKFLPWWTVDN